MSSQILCPQLIVDETKNQFIIKKIISKPVANKIEKMMSQAFECVENENFFDALKLYDLALRDVIRARIDKEQAEFVTLFDPERWDYYRIKL